MSISDPKDIYLSTVGGSGIAISNHSSYQSITGNFSNKEDFQKLSERLAGIEERLAILRPNWELQARFPALQDAYDHYRLIEKLVNDQNKNMVIK